MNNKKEKLFKKKPRKKDIQIKNEVFERTESIRKDVEEERRYFENIELEENNDLNYEISENGN